MKNFVIALSFLFTLPALAGEVITCQPYSDESIRVDKENGMYFYSINGQKKMELANAQTIQAKDLRRESTLKEIIAQIGLNPKDILRVNVYKLSQDDDGGRTIIRFILKDDYSLALIVSIGGIRPCL